MKENFNIEELFKQKFDNFQPDVDPSVWANIQAGIGAAGTAAAGGIATAVKIGLISGGIIAASVATWYFGFYEAESSNQNLTEQTVISEQVENPVENTTEPLRVVNDHNDQLIQENQQHTGSEQHSYSTNDQNNDNETDLNAVTTNGSAPNNSNSANANSGSATNTDNNNTQHAVENHSNDAADVEDKHKEQLPTGRMEFTQSSVYAPSVLSFVSNARNFEEVHWDFGDGTTAEGIEVKHTYSKPGKYEVRMSVVGEKTTYEESQEVVIKSKSGIDNVPNIITPNGDRINDFFAVKTTEIETFYITITDNRGNEVFTSNDKDFAWDGTDYSGQTVEKGIYTYVIIAEGKDGSVIKLPGQVYVQ